MTFKVGQRAFLRINGVDVPARVSRVVEVHDGAGEYLTAVYVVADRDEGRNCGVSGPEYAVRLHYEGWYTGGRRGIRVTFK